MSAAAGTPETAALAKAGQYKVTTMKRRGRVHSDLYRYVAEGREISADLLEACYEATSDDLMADRALALAVKSMLDLAAEAGS